MKRGQVLGWAAGYVFVRLLCRSPSSATPRGRVAPPKTAPPRPHTKRTAPVGRPVCRPARSAFFGRGIGIADAHHAVLALAHRYSGFAPGAALLPAQAGLVQRA